MDKNIFDMLPKDSYSKLSPELQEELLTEVVVEEKNSAKVEEAYKWTALIFSTVFIIVTYLVMTSYLPYGGDIFSKTSFFESFFTFVFLLVGMNYALRLAILKKGSVFRLSSLLLFMRREKVETTGEIAQVYGIILFVVGIVAYIATAIMMIYERKAML